MIFYDDFVVGGVGDAAEVGAEADGGAVAGAVGVAAGAPGFEPVSTGFTSIFWGCLCEDGGDPPWFAGTAKLKKFKLKFIHSEKGGMPKKFPLIFLFSLNVY